MEYKILADFLANETVTLKHNTLKALLQISCFNQLTKKEPLGYSYLLWNLYRKSSDATISSNNIYLALGSSPFTRNFI